MECANTWYVIRILELQSIKCIYIFIYHIVNTYSACWRIYVVIHRFNSVSKIRFIKIIPTLRFLIFIGIKFSLAI